MGAGGSAGAKNSVATGFDGEYGDPSEEYQTVETIGIAWEGESACVASGRWKDQGWGNQKGGVRLALVRDGRDVAVTTTPEVAPHDWDAFELRLDAASALPGDELQVRVKVGGGGGHQLCVRDSKLQATNSAAAAAAVSFDGEYHEASDAFVTAARATVPDGGLAQCVARGRWKDQGWGNQKGTAQLALVRDGRDVAVATTVEKAPHDWGAFELRLDDASTSSALPGDEVQVRVVVGGGGGHQLNVRDSSIATTTSSGGLSEEDIVSMWRAAAEKWLSAAASGDTQAASGAAAAHFNLPLSLSRSDVVTVFNVELLELMTLRSTTQDCAAPNFSRENVAMALQRQLQFFQWVLAQHRHDPFFQGGYGSVCQEASDATTLIVQLLVKEFSLLVQVPDPVVIRKVVALDQFSGFAKLEGCDLSRVDDQREFERETAALVIQMWADTKRGGGT